MSIQQWQAPASTVQSIPASVVRLVDAFQESEAAYQLAERLVQTSFCPAAFRGKPGEAAAAMMAGAEIGLSPLAALAAFDVIDGRAAARAITLRAVVQARGHEIELVESSDTKCKMRGRRAGAEAWQTVLWTIDRAKLAGLINNPKKPNWANWPAAMLVARATSELARLIAADALLGLGGGYSAEEIADGFDDGATVTASQVPAATAPRRTLAYRQAPPEAIESQIDTQDAPEAVEAVDQDTGEIVAEVVEPEQVKTPEKRRLMRRPQSDNEPATPSPARQALDEHAEEILAQHPIYLGGTEPDDVDTVTNPAEWCPCGLPRHHAGLHKPSAPDVAEQQSTIRDLKAELQQTRDEPTQAEQAAIARARGGRGTGPNVLTAEQRGKIMALFTRLGITNRDERLEYTGVVVGHTVESSSSLTKGEAHKLIEHLLLIPDGIAAQDAVSDEGDIGAEQIAEP